MLCLVSCSWIFLCYCPLYLLLFLFLFNDTATTELYTLSLHDALPISRAGVKPRLFKPVETGCDPERPADALALREAAGSDAALDEVCPYRFTLPAAPLVAAQAAGTSISIEHIEALVSRGEGPIVLEAAGGLFVPITREVSSASLEQADPAERPPAQTLV